MHQINKNQERQDAQGLIDILDLLESYVLIDDETEYNSLDISKITAGIQEIKNIILSSQNEKC